jgi:hypothetical protein
MSQVISAKVYHLHDSPIDQGNNSILLHDGKSKLTQRVLNIVHRRFPPANDHPFGFILIPVYDIHNRHGESAQIAVEIFGS